MGTDNPYEALQTADTTLVTEAWRFGAAALAGALLAALVLAVCAWPCRNSNARRLQIGGPLALGAGFWLAAYLLTGRPHSWMLEDVDRLLTILVPAIVIIEVLAVFLPRFVGWSLRVLLACLVGRIVLHGTSFLVDPTGLGLATETWSTTEALIWLAGMTAILLTAWWPLTYFPPLPGTPGRGAGGEGSKRASERSADSPPTPDASPLTPNPSPRSTGERGAIAFALAIAAAGAGIMILNYGYMTGGKLAILLSIILFTLAVVSLLFRPLSSGFIGVAIVLLFSLLLMGRFFGSLSTPHALILLFAPLLSGVGRLPWLRSQSPVLRNGLSLIAVATPVVFLVAPEILPYNTRIVLLGVTLLGASSGVVGCFAVLRRRALTGDALAHAALPGVFIAYLLMRTRFVPALLFGAFASGIAGILIIAALRRWTRIKEDAALGIVLGVFFGAGIFLRSVVQQMPDGAKAGLNSYIEGKTASMIWDDVLLIIALAVGTLIVLLGLYKELKLISFDKEFAQTQGWPAAWLDLLIMTLIAVTVVIGLPAVGVVMMAALLIIPAVTARFWTERLTTMIFLAATTGALMGAMGSFISNTARVPAGPAIILVGAALFGLSALAAPRRGLLTRAWTALRFRAELQERKLLRVLFELSEPRLPDRPVLPSASILARKSWSPAQLFRLLRSAAKDGLVQSAADGYRLTDAGVQRAAAVMRGHRLWELFLREYPDLAQTTANLSAESVEELLPEAMVEELIARLPPQVKEMPA